MRASVGHPAPPAVPTTTGGGGGWSWLLTAGGIIEAHLVRGRLEGAGIDPIVLDTRDPSPGAWMFPSGDVNALVRVYVRTVQLEDARLALLEDDVATAPGVPAEPRRAQPRWLFALVVATAGLVVVLLVLLTAAGSPSCVARVAC